jgi:hypothetical protein
VNSFLNLRVADIWACNKERRAKGAFFLTEPLENRGWEWRCYMRDPDGYLIEVGQYTQAAIDRFKDYDGRIAKRRCFGPEPRFRPYFGSRLASTHNNAEKRSAVHAAEDDCAQFLPAQGDHTQGVE